ncbi:MAG: hypothetical protein V9F02_09990 [Chitinophagaceae bacterium]
MATCFTPAGLVQVGRWKGLRVVVLKLALTELEQVIAMELATATATQAMSGMLTEAVMVEVKKSFFEAPPKTIKMKKILQTCYVLILAMLAFSASGQSLSGIVFREYNIIMAIGVKKQHLFI